jgi:hypothetical protein
MAFLTYTREVEKRMQARPLPRRPLLQARAQGASAGTACKRRRHRPGAFNRYLRHLAVLSPAAVRRNAAIARIGAIFRRK